MPAPADGIGARRVTSLLPIMGSWGGVTPFRRRPGGATAGIDLYRASARAVAETDLRLATAAGIGDWFRFEIHGPRPLADTGGVRLPVTAFVGDTVWAAFHADLAGAGVRMTGEPEHVPPLVPVVMPDVAQHGYPAYPLVDHVADKVSAMFE